MPKEIKVKIKGQTWRVVQRKLGREYADGMCWSDGIIEIDPRLKGRRKLDTLIHEFLHAINPDWTENRVKTMAAEIATALHKMGWREIID